MLTHLTAQPKDKILMLMQMFRDDPRADKIDLGVGVYKDASGTTPIMQAVKTAEKQLWETQTTKSYTGLAGDPGFHDAMIQLVLGDSVARNRVAAAATPGGTGAIRQALELVRMASPDATVWVSSPTWPNHMSILRYMGLKFSQYRYFDDASRAVDFQAMTQDLSQVKSGDVVLLHGCCHNPTGANLNPSQWADLTGILLETGAIPFVDIAYQGFGDGLYEDTQGLRHLVARVPEALIAASCSKNFGIYRERTGILMAVSDRPENTGLTQDSLAFLNRQNYSFPPDHGARLVTMILQNPDLRATWQAELETMRTTMLALRQQLATELQQHSGSDRFGFLASHRGMFSRLGATLEQVQALRRDHGIYLVDDSRMNIAGLNAQSVPILARAIIDVGI